MIAQTCRDYELILVDDGSTDHSAAMCDQLARQHHCRVIHQENGGLGAARNTGIEAAQGDYLFFLDSDDFLSPDTLQGLTPLALSPPTAPRILPPLWMIFPIISR